MSNMQSSGQPSSHTKMFLLALDSTPLTFLQENISTLPNIGALLRSGRTVETESPQTFSALVLGQHLRLASCQGNKAIIFPCNGMLRQ